MWKPVLSLLLLFLLSSCAVTSEPKVVACDLYAQLSVVNLDEMSPDALRTWVEEKYPDASLERDTGALFYDESYWWQSESIEYVANYREGRLLYIQAYLPHNSPHQLIECLGEPPYSSATLIPPLIYFGFFYPAQGVTFGGTLSDLPDSRNYEEPAMSSVRISRPSPDIAQFSRDTSHDGSADALQFVDPWQGWEQMEIHEGWE